MQPPRWGGAEQINMTPQGKSSEKSIYRIPPYFYLHVLDQTTNVTRVETGPKTYVRNENEQYV